MISKIKEAIKKIEETEEFKKYKEENPDLFLADTFIILNENEGWQIDYYSEDKDKITSFTQKNESVQIKESELFRKEKTEMIPLNLEKIKFSLEQALKVVETQTKEKPSKLIVVLQVLNDKEVWNITYLTTSFKTINFKINAINGEIISKDESSIVSNLRVGDFIKKK